MPYHIIMVHSKFDTVEIPTIRFEIIFIEFSFKMNCMPVIEFVIMYR